MSITRKVKRALRGDAGVLATSLEASRRLAVALRRRREQAMLYLSRGQSSSTEPVSARFASAFSHLNRAQLLAHFRERTNSRFFEGFEARPAKRASQLEAPLREDVRE